MQVSASFLSSNNVKEDLIKLNNTDVDYIHVDIMDGKFVKNKTMPFRKLSSLYKFTSKRLDVHLMVEKPIEYIKKYAYLNVEYIYIHVELNEDINTLLKLIKSYGIKCGLAINPDTSIEKIIPYLDLVDIILVMSVYPGMGGQSFIEESVSKVNEIRKLINEKNRNIRINIDGGINCDTIDKISNTDIVVSGSYITNSNNFQESIDKLRK